MACPACGCPGFAPGNSGGGIANGDDGRIVLLQSLRCNPAPPPGTLRWAQFLSDEKLGKESLRAFPPKNLPWGTRQGMRQAYGRPVTLTVAPSSATTPGYPGQLALWLGGIPVRAYSGEAVPQSPPGSSVHTLLLWQTSVTLRRICNKLFNLSNQFAQLIIDKILSLFHNRTPVLSASSRAPFVKYLFVITTPIWQ